MPPPPQHPSARSRRLELLGEPSGGEEIFDLQPRSRAPRRPVGPSTPRAQESQRWKNIAICLFILLSLLILGLLVLSVS